MTRTRTLAAATTAGLLALAVSACSDDNSNDSSTSTSTSSGSGSPSSSSTSGSTPADRSQQIFDAYEPPEVLASTSGDVVIGLTSAHTRPVKFAVTSVRATKDSTILRYQLTSTTGSEELLGMSGRYWYDMPTLHVPGSDTQLQSVTASVPEGKRREAQERCVCTSVDSAGTDPRPEMVMYPPLPQDATEVTITFNQLDPVTVPVTR